MLSTTYKYKQNSYQMFKISIPKMHEIGQMSKLRLARLWVENWKANIRLMFCFPSFVDIRFVSLTAEKNTNTSVANYRGTFSSRTLKFGWMNFIFCAAVFVCEYMPIYLGPLIFFLVVASSIKRVS